MKKDNKTLFITCILCLLPVVLALVLYDKLPDQIPIHFSGNGTPDNYLPKALAVFGLPVILTAINAYLHFRLSTDPRKENASFAIKQISKWLVPVLSLVFLPISMFMSMGAEIPIATIGTALAGVVIVICGNYLPKCRRNYTVGIKLPWTLDNEDNWNKTHRFAGYLWVVVGIALIVSAFFVTVYVIVGAVVLLVALPIVYSYLTYRKQCEAGQ